MSVPIFYQIVCAIILVLLYYCFFRTKSRCDLPPGPKPLPIVGNLLDLPPPDQPAYKHWLKFKDIYGPISSVTILGTTLVLLHDKEATHELLNKKSSKTSNRPQHPFASDLCGYGVFLSSQMYDDTYRHHRKLVHQQMGTKTLVKKFYGIQDVESRRFLFRVLNEPDSLMRHIKTEASAIMLKITYGYSIAPHTSDPLVAMVEHMMENLSRAFVPMVWMVDIIPSLKYLPEWFPGASFKKTARKWKQNTDMTMGIPYSFVRKKMAIDRHFPSYVSSLVSQYNVDGTNKGQPKLRKDDEDAIKSTACVMYGAGADTTVTTIAAFILAMVRFPDVQRKAQKEIDDIVGIGNLPEFEHQEQLPYINAVVKEALRWFPVLPIGTTHVTQEELKISGYYIPKGSYLLPSMWWFLNDPETYLNPSEFEPERFLAPRNEPNPEENAFGYGHRICQGRFLANDNMFLMVSRLLATFNISKAVDEENNEIMPDVGGIPGLINHPGNFPYRISPRSAQHVELIKSIVIDHPWDESDAQFLKELSGKALGTESNLVAEET